LIYENWFDLEMRRKMGEAAVAAAKAVGYVGAGKRTNMNKNKTKIKQNKHK